jgi:hypothetical protein
LIPRIHTYAALATLVNLLVYAVAGIAPRTLPTPAVIERPFLRGASESDRAVAGRVVRMLDLSLATPVHDFNIGHDNTGRLVLDFYHANGRDKVTVLPDRLRIAESRAGFGKYLATLHVTSAAFHSGDWRLQLWAWYNEFAMWSLAVMLATGAWMLWTRRPGKRTHWWAALVSLPVLAIFAVTAVQMAHRKWTAALRPLNALHRSHAFAPVASVMLVVLAATGLWLWLTGRDRRTGGVLLTLGAAISGGLMLWMRASG